MASKSKRQKNKQKKLRRKKLANRRKRPPRWSDAIDHATYLIGRNQWSGARDVLEGYERDNPGHRGVLRLLLDVYHHQHDFGLYCRICQRLLEKDQCDPELHAMLAGGYLADGRMASALRAFRHFVARWPDHPFAEGARETIAKLEVAVDELLDDMPFPEDEKLELGAMHEEVLACLTTRDYARAVRFAEQILDRCPIFVPALNNVSEAYFQTGQRDKAIATSQQVLELEPDNFHALANLSRHLLLSGRRQEAELMADRLRHIRSDKPDVWCKKAETYSYFGDDDAVLEALAEAEGAGCTSDQTPDVAMLYHFAAVASARQGNDRQAKQYWRDAQKIKPAFGLVKDNLADAERPRTDRHGPWPFSIDYWVQKETIDDLEAEARPGTDGKDDDAAARAAQRFADQHPEVVDLVPALLDRGDEPGRRLAWMLAKLLATPEMLDALREFCLSQRGPDKLRIETANDLYRRDLISSGAIRMWLKGEWQEIELFGFEITDEPVGPTHSEQVDEWGYQAMQCIQRGDGKTAETLLTKAIEVEGEKPDLLNNLASAYQAQGRMEESLELARQVHERWPDYFFGRIVMANLSTNNGDYEQTERYLAPLRRRKRLHETEFKALCVAYIQLGLARRDSVVAKRWLTMLKDFDPEHPSIKHFERMLALGGALGKLAKRAGRR